MRSIAAADSSVISRTTWQKIVARRYALAGEVLIGSSMVAFKYNSYENGNTGAEPEPEPGAEFWLLLGDKVARVDDYYEFRSTEKNAAPRSRIRASKEKYLKSGLSEAAVDRYRTRLLELMNDEKVYLQSDLNLPKLAGMVNCSVNHLSQVINAEFSMSFFEYLNQHRVADARHMLANDPKCHALDVALKVGFNSNSTFYSAFKKICHVTPAEYRRQAPQFVRPQGHTGSYYAATANDLTEYAPLRGDERADVCVIGAGFSGVSTALHLVERGYRVLVLEANRVGWGASGRNGGELIGGIAGEKRLLKYLSKGLSERQSAGRGEDNLGLALGWSRDHQTARAGL